MLGVMAVSESRNSGDTGADGGTDGCQAGLDTAIEIEGPERRAARAS